MFMNRSKHGAQEGSKMAELGIETAFLDSNSLLFMEGDEQIIGQETVISDQPLIALQPSCDGNFGDANIEVIEEVIDQSATFLVEDVPNICQEQEISSQLDIQNTSLATQNSTKKRKIKPMKGKSLKKFKQGNDEEGTTEIDVPRKWERKKVQIKTLDGEFSVTVWATGIYFL